MKHSILILLVALLIGSAGESQAKNKLKFREGGTFKIVQFTDTHFDQKSGKSDAVLLLMNEVLDLEKPDLVIFTGDAVTQKPSAEGWKKLTEPLVSRQIPWAAAFGNHDDEYDLTRKEIRTVIQNIPYNLNQVGPKKVPGFCNYLLPLQSSGSPKVAALLYCMDSNAYTPIKGVGSYGWFLRPQIDWYVETSQKQTRLNGGTPLPALAFFHIPLPEYTEAFEKGDISPIGRKDEKVCSPVINTGLFAAMLEQGDVMATFTGHDHVNNYISSLHGLGLIYGQFSGGTNTYGDQTGARIIEMKEGERSFKTWIRYKGGEKIHEAAFPFKKAENPK